MGSTDTTERMGKTRSVVGDIDPEANDGERRSGPLVAVPEGVPGSSCMGDTTCFSIRPWCWSKGSPSVLGGGSAMEVWLRVCAGV